MNDSLGGATTSWLQPRADGLLDASRLPAFPIVAPRLQGELSPTGELDLSLWGEPVSARVRLTGFDRKFVVSPGRLEGEGGCSLSVAQSAPALAIRGLKLEVLRQPDGGRLILEQRGDDTLLALGASGAEAVRASTLDLSAIEAEAEAHVRRCDLMPTAEPLLRSMVMQGVHAALSSRRETETGAFAGLAAGLAYTVPARTYYRDGYWTLQLLLRIAPDVAKAQIELLADGVHEDGEAPSGVITAAPEANQLWERLRLSRPVLAAIHWRPGEWWSDHFDSPLLFVLAVGDYVEATGDLALAQRLWPKLQAVCERYRRLAGTDGLPLKPRNDRDWADNVFREGLVAYDLGLWVGALDVAARLGEQLDPLAAARARAEAAQARAAIDRTLWRGGWYADFVRADGSAEDHLALDSLTLLRHDAAPQSHALAALEQARLVLESRRNDRQPWGDFGMLCVFPLFARQGDLRDKSAFPYRYHNGADWPWLDALYAGERLRRGLDGWRYPLLRWWEYALAQGWAGAVEYASPPFGRGSLLQAWSSLPAAIALSHAEQVLAGDSDLSPTWAKPGDQPIMEKVGGATRA
jgi:glycogen debranching enzyme